MSRRKTPKLKKLTKVKEVKLRARARARIGAVPATKRIENARRKPPKHKNREQELEAEIGL